MNDDLMMRLKLAAREDGWTIGSASAAELQQAEVKGLPKELIEFYRRCNPQGFKKQPPLDPPLDDASDTFPWPTCPLYRLRKLKQSLYSLDQILDPMDEEWDALAFANGFIHFAENIYGDRYCMDVNVRTEAAPPDCPVHPRNCL
jgi:hypothetical protein